MITCPICGNNHIKSVTWFRADSPVFSGCKRATCSICDLVFATPMPSETELLAYNTNYFSSAHAGKPSRETTLAFFSGIARLRLTFVRRYLDRYQIKVDRILELGPGLGYFLKSWLEKYPTNTYSVVETDITCHKSLEDIGAQLVNFTDITLSDLVVMSHVLEHVSNPVTFIHSATRGLEPGGVIFIEVPCQDWKYKKLDEPHVLFFDKKSMRLLLEKSGFDDIEISYYGKPLGDLRSRSWLYDKFMTIREKLINLGFVTPFSKMEEGLEGLNSPLERAMVAPFWAHRESKEPACWLRVMARKL